ncbi:hypothetical protein ACFVXE_37790 [Streptomyces sp. NPDC058231]|uniref:hypothetical protein n=1 Tax=Streptomyces sp. NPDC058231 TaxID=3346392 RepID=UPI0036F106F5
MSRQDEREAGGAAAGIERALDRQRRLGRIGPQDIRPVLEGLAAPDRVTVENRIAGTSSTRMEGSRFGVSVGATACVTGAVDGARVWTSVGGRHPETGCMEPPPVR